MKTHLYWRALFTQTGSEIYGIYRVTGILPDTIITNKSIEKIDKICPELLEVAFDRMLFVPSTPTEGEYKTAIKSADIVTLHGYLRIIPASICKQYVIYNGHPGIITRYPELKGKDPQLRAWNANIYPWHGHVIHSVIPEVDGGKVVSARDSYCEDVHKQYGSFDNYIAEHKRLALNNWLDFLRGKGFNKKNETRL